MFLTKVAYYEWDYSNEQMYSYYHFVNRLIINFINYRSSTFRLGKSRSDINGDDLYSCANTISIY